MNCRICWLNSSGCSRFERCPDLFNKCILAFLIFLSIKCDCSGGVTVSYSPQITRVGTKTLFNCEQVSDLSAIAPKDPVMETEDVAKITFLTLSTTSCL